MIFLGPQDTQETWSSSQRSHEAATMVEGAPPALWAPRDSPHLILSPIYSHIFPNHQKYPQKHFSTAATFYTCEIPSWGLSDILPEGDSVTEGFYINPISLLMKREQVTSDLRVHSKQLDCFFTLFDSQYHVILDVLGDISDVIFFCGVFVEIR